MLRLREMRHRKKLTMREVAAELHCSVNTIWRQEKGLQQPSIDTLRRMSTLYQCTLDELAGNETSNPTIPSPEIPKAK